MIVQPGTIMSCHVPAAICGAPKTQFPLLPEEPLAQDITGLSLVHPVTPASLCHCLVLLSVTCQLAQT